MSEPRASILPTGTLAFLVVDADVRVFETPVAALASALELRRSERELPMALHTGPARVRADGRYIGPAIRTAAHLCGIANPGQTLVSAMAVADLPSDTLLVDLGVHRLRDLSPPIRVFRLADSADVAPRSLDRVPNNLPVHLTGFIGRDAELAAVRALLRESRLVTLTGVGGGGKSRLAAQVAAQQADDWADGVWWVELASLTGPANVAEEVVSTMGLLVEPTRGALRSLIAQVRDRRVLVCLDNCDQVLRGAAAVVDALLRSCPELTVLTTSREPLGVPGEVVWQLPPLDEDDALMLFIERASLVRPWFTLDAWSEAAVRGMCARLDGIPLALELAAAWLRTLTPQQIEAGLDHRFSLLVRGPRGAAPRQQTLAASIDWSHALLDVADQMVFRRLAVFPAGFGLDAARVVCADEVLDALGRLVDKSLLVAEERAGEARYRLLETIRAYAADRLADAHELAATRDRHLDYFLALVEGFEPERQRDMDNWRIRLEREYDNLRAALDWGLAAPDAQRGRRLAAALPWLWHLHAHGDEGIEYLGRAIRRAPEDRSRLQAQLLTGVALVVDTAHPLDLEYDAAQRAVDIATEHGDDGQRGLCLELSAVGEFYTDFDAACRTLADATRAAERAGDAFVIEGAHALQGIIMHLRDRHAEAESLLQSAIEGLLRRHRGVAATALGYQACGALYTGEFARAQQLAEQAVRVAEPLGDYLRVGSTRSVLALVLGHAGHLDAGFEVMRPVLRLIEGAENDVFVPGLARAMGSLHLWRGEPEQAARWFEREARSTDRGIETFLAAHALPGHAAALAALSRLDQAQAALDTGLRVARRLGMPRVIADCFEQQAHLTAAADPDRAIDLHHEALALRVEYGLRTFWVDSLDALAALADASIDTVRVLAATDAARGALGYPRDTARQARHAAKTGALRQRLASAFDAAWTEGARMRLDEAVAYVRRSRGTRRRPTVGWASLTPTELDVVRCVVDGLNNPEIGSRLFMSRGTVKTHLSHVFAKLGVTNRTELAMFAGARLAATESART